MRKPNIFIASSGRAKRLAERLQQKLKDSARFEKVWLWCEGDGDWLGRTITQVLEDSAIKGDFAAVILTPDDIRIKEKKEGRVPRDNCIFESGLFIGALGVDFERCFLLCSIDESSLPSDLHALQRLFFVEPDLTNETACDKAVQPFIDRILDKVGDKGIFSRPQIPLITETELIEVENDLIDGSVVVSTLSIGETNSAFMKTVMGNIQNNVDYLYFVHLSPERIKPILNLVQMLSLGGLSGEVDAKLSFEQRLETMGKNKELVQKNLDFLHDHLSIHFLPYDPPVLFRIHNDHIAEIAKCYSLYSGNRFAEWDVPGIAKAIADELRRQRREDQDAVFRSTQRFNLDDNQNLKQMLRKRIDMYFSENVRAKALEVCLGNEAGRSAVASEGAALRV